jgi:hypothetical protein
VWTTHYMLWIMANARCNAGALIILSFTSIEWAPVCAGRSASLRKRSHENAPFVHLSVYAMPRSAVQNGNGCIIGAGAHFLPFLSYDYYAGTGRVGCPSGQERGPATTSLRAGPQVGRTSERTMVGAAKSSPASIARVTPTPPTSSSA